MLMVALGGWTAASAGDDRPVIDPDVRAGAGGAPLRILVELHVAHADAIAIGSVQDEVLRRLAGTGARLTRRYSTAPILALEIDPAVLVRLEEMRGLVARVRVDRISSPYEGPAPPRR